MIPDRLPAAFLILASSPKPPAPALVPVALLPLPPELDKSEFVVARRCSAGSLMPYAPADGAVKAWRPLPAAEPLDETLLAVLVRLSVMRSTTAARRRGCRFSLLLEDELVGRRRASSASSLSSSLLAELATDAGMTAAPGSSSRLDSDSRISPSVAGFLPPRVRRCAAGSRGWGGGGGPAALAALCWAGWREG